MFQEDNILFEDFLDDIEKDVALKKVDVKSVIGDSDVDADDTLVDYELTCENYDYIIEALTIQPRMSGPEKTTEYYEGIMRRFGKLFGTVSRIREHSPLHFFLGKKEYHLPEDIDNMCHSRRNYFTVYDSDYMTIKFGMNGRISNARSLLRLMWLIDRACWGSAFYMKIWIDDEHGADINRVTPIGSFLGFAEQKIRNNWLSNETESVKMYEEWMKFVLGFFGMDLDASRFVHDRMFSEDYLVSEIFAQLLERRTHDERTRKMELYSDMKKRLDGKPLNADFIRESEYPGYYCCSSTDYGKDVVLDIETCSYIGTGFAEEVRKCNIVPVYQMFRVLPHAYAFYCAWLGMFDIKDSTVETGNRINFVTVYFMGPIEHRDFWDCLGGLYGVEFTDNEIEKMGRKYGAIS